MQLMSKQPLICATITAPTTLEFLSKIKTAALYNADIAELRIDSLNHQTLRNVEKIIAESALPLIVTNRNKANGGINVSSEPDRLAVLYNCILAKPAFIDIEIDTAKLGRDKIINFAKKNDVGIICSYHDFGKTPSYKEIIKIHDMVSESGSDIVKLVFSARTKTNVEDILKAVSHLRSSTSLTTIFGMGNAGQDTRLLSPALGSCLTYCSLETNPNGLSQISIKDTRAVFDHLLQNNTWKTIRSEDLAFLATAISESIDKKNYPFIGNHFINAISKAF